jgi:outer membrane protein assembly factor BamB
MTLRTRRTVVVLLGLAAGTSLACLEPLWGQQPARPIRPIKLGGAMGQLPGQPDAGPDEAAQSIQLPTDGRLKKKLDAARDYIKEQSWGEASRILQSLLDAEQDSFVDVLGKDHDGKPTHTNVSVRVEAEHLLSTFPAAGLEHYRLSYGATARELLNRARTGGDAELLAQIVKRYLYTDAGREAIRLLATHELDRGRFPQAALYFARLLKLPGNEQPAPSVLVQAALAFHRARDHVSPETAKQYKQLEDDAWKDLAERVGSSVRLGDRAIPLAQLREEVNRYRDSIADVNQRDTSVFAGNVSRTHQGQGDKPFMVQDWAHPAIKEEQTRHLVDSAVKLAEGRGLPVLPSFFPVAADGKVIYRDYWGLHVRDLKTGKVAWESDSRYSIDRLLGEDGGSRQQYVTTWAQQYFQMMKPGMLFENSVVGTLSTDASRVYAIEDLYLPPSNQGMPWNGGPVVMPNQMQHSYGQLRDAVFANKLNAYSLRTGKLLWEVSGPADKDDPKEETEHKGDSNDVGESYFLGPPLPLHGKLYVLGEKNQDLRLICLDPEHGEVQWVQLLATTQSKLSQDVSRRTWAAHLAYGEGILVCPTNAGMLLGVDLLSHSVVWAHPYREKGQAPAPNPMQQRLWMRGGVMMQDGNPNLASAPEWKVTAPVVQDGRVVFTAPDGSSVRCLNLRDGSLVWKAARTDDDLYLGGVVRGKVLIVGKKECRALRLADGTKVWQTATGLPSGQGVATENLYYLPLKEGRNREPEVCALDVNTGKDVSHTRSRQKELPGNLLLYDGDVISQTVDEVAAYPQLKVKKEQMNARIAQNPTDPIGLTERAELNLDDGKLAEAIGDLQTALAHNPPAETRAKARAQLYDALTDYLRDHFDAGEKYLKDYEELCKVEVGPDASSEERQRAQEEQQRRMGNYLSLVARGEEKQGRLTEAFGHYLEFAERASHKELVSVPDDKADKDVKAPAAVWAHGRISAMITRANPNQREALEGLIARRWRDLEHQADTDRLRQFVALFGSEFRVGREARFALAERLAEENGKNAMLEAERQFLLLARQREDRPLAARATEALARLMARNGLLEDAAHYYRVLGQDFADVPVRDGKTGADFLNDLATDKRFLPYLEEPGQALGGAKVGLQTENGMFQPGQVLFGFEPEGDVLPYFRRYRVGLDPNLHNFRLVDRETNEVVWQAPLTRTQFFNFAGQPGQVPGGQAPRYTFHAVGHLIVLPVGHMVFGIDPLGRQILWEQSLLGPLGQTPGGNISTHQDPKDGSVQILFQDGFIMRLGQCGPAAPAYVCLQTRDGLLALDPITGQTLWTRTDVRQRGQVFGDDQHVYLVETSTEGNPIGSRAFRVADGVTAKDVPDFTAAYQNRQRIDGRRIFTSESRSGGLVFRLYDVPTGKEVWKKECPTGTVPVHCEEAHQGGVLEPDGSLTVLDLPSAREVLKTKVEARDVEKVQRAALLQDRTQYYLAIEGPRDVNVNPWGPITNFQPGTGYRCVPVHGRVYAFDRATGKVNWATLEIPQQMLVLEQFREMPILLFTSRISRMANGRFGGMAVNGAALTVADKRTGKFLKDEQNLNAQQFHTFHADLREGKIELVGYNLKVTLTLQTGAATAEARGLTR